MKTGSEKRRFVIWFGLCLIIYGLAGQTVRARSGLSFRLVKSYFVVIPVQINGQGPFDFLLDTGTNTTLIIPELARQLNLRPTDQVSLITLSGTQVVPRAMIDHLRLATRAVARLEVLFDDLRGLRSVDSKICGVLGQNFLSHFNYLLDYRERRIEFDEEGELESRLQGTPLQIEQNEGKLMILAQAALSVKETLRLVLDSGASDLVIFAPASIKMEFELERRESLLITTNAMGKQVKCGLLPGLQIGSERLVDLPIALIRSYASPDYHATDGLLPTRLFRAIFFQHDKHFVILNPRAS
jgi:predicted aspartyl protease